MQSTISVLLLIALNISSVVTTPTAFIDLETPAQNVSTASIVDTNATLGAVFPARGPDAFSVQMVQATTPLRANDTFATVINLLHDILIDNDFKDRMPQARNTYRRENIGMIINTVNSDEPIFIRYVVWAMAQLTNYMAQSMGFRACKAELLWRKKVVGSIVIIGYPNTLSKRQYGDLGLSYNDVNQTSINAANIINNEGLTWTFNPHGVLLDSSAVPMATIGGIVQAAQFDESHMFEIITGTYPQYRAFQIYAAIDKPPIFSRRAVIKTLGVAAIWALQREDFHELRVEVLLDDRKIADGGIADPFPGRPGLLNFGDVTTS